MLFWYIATSQIQKMLVSCWQTLVCLGVFLGGVVIFIYSCTSAITKEQVAHSNVVVPPNSESKIFVLFHVWSYEVLKLLTRFEFTMLWSFFRKLRGTVRLLIIYKILAVSAISFIKTVADIRSCPVLTCSAILTWVAGTFITIWGKKAKNKLKE